MSIVGSLFSAVLLLSSGTVTVSVPVVSQPQWETSAFSVNGRVVEPASAGGALMIAASNYLTLPKSSLSSPLVDKLALPPMIMATIESLPEYRLSILTLELPTEQVNLHRPSATRAGYMWESAYHKLSNEIDGVRIRYVRQVQYKRGEQWYVAASWDLPIASRSGRGRSAAVGMADALGQDRNRQRLNTGWIITIPDPNVTEYRIIHGYGAFADR
ncbi:hypothetical protein IC617_08645 [Neiella sp. HB171785]|uniref:YjbF family lipoprotein n=1 Tax=Neiella litorisoli TaxID=2771431 RepID=A0A8J6QRS7_9GAMM|nr:hypothetical protein [Neiella litorisoli]MBD1389494.1 hypothetical protein [Neiella litorisoli]